MKKYLLIILSFFLSASLAAQVGEIQGKVTDPDLGEGLPFATVTVTVNGSLLGAQTDFDGFYSIKPLPPGQYDVSVMYVGYRTAVTKDVIVSADKITFLDIDLLTESELLDEIVVVEYKVPLMQADETSTGATVTREEIANLPTRNVTSIASTTAGVYQADEGRDVNVKGARSEATDYYVDGIKVRGSTAVPAAAIEQMSVITGGVPAKYGDATGGIINITTRGPSRTFGGSLEVLTSEFLDPYGYNLFTGSLAGPIIKANKGEPNERALLGFFLAAEYLTERDDNPSHFDIPRVKSSVKDSLIANPLRRGDLGGFQKNTDFITEDDLEFLDARDNIRKNEFNGNLKFDFQPVTNLNFTLGGSYNWYTGGLARRTRGFKDFARRFELFADERIPEIEEKTYRGFLRFTQRFGSKGADEEKGEADVSFFSNAYYSIQLDYTKATYRRQDPLHEDRFFDFGYVGEFTTNKTPVYSFDILELIDENGEATTSIPGKNGENLALVGYQFEGIAIDGVNYESGDLNPISTAHNEQYFELAGEDQSFYRSLDAISSNFGFLNGQRTSERNSAYNIYYMPGAGSGTFLKTEDDQYRLSFNGSVDVKKPGSSDRNKHAIEFGFEYEQRVDRSYRIWAAELWDRMRARINDINGGIERDKTIDGTYLLIDGQQVGLGDYDPNVHGVFGVFDTITFDYVRTGQTYFDREFRKRFGLEDIQANPIVDTDAYHPDELSLDLFSPDDLYGSGSFGDKLVAYSGYDYQGNKLTDQPAFEDFWRASDDDLFYPRQVGAYRPVYMAGYIQDKFSFKDLIFNVGVRVDRFDANQKVLRDLYSLYGTVKAGDIDRLRNAFGDQDFNVPETIGDDFVVYVDDEVNPSSVKGYRDGTDWYNSEGKFVNDANILKEGGSVKPFLSDPLDDKPADDIRDDAFVEKISTAFEDYKPQISIMPRISFSFPISDEATFFANYSILTQRPQSNINAYPVDYYFFNVDATINNAGLKPEKTISYQVGFKQKVSRTSAISISTFYREMRDMIQQVQIPLGYPVETYRTLGNVDFGNVKGFELSYDLRRTGNIRLITNYTLQFADGTGSDAFGASNQVGTGQGNIRSIRPLNFDSRHSINVTMDYRYSDGSNYNGPVIGKAKILANAGANLILRANSGTPFTRQRVPTPDDVQFGRNARPVLEGQINGSRKPWNFRMDLNVDKDFNLNFGKKEGKKKSSTAINVYLQVQNLLNSQNTLSVYAATGSGDNDGYLLFAEGIDDAENRTSPDSFRLLYSYFMQNPNNFNFPRRIRLGASISF